MKNLSIVLNVVLFVAVIVLYVSVCTFLAISHRKLQ